MTSRPAPARLLTWLALPVALAAVSALAPWGHVNAATAGLLYLVVVLAVSTWGGSVAGFVAALAALVCFNLFFLPPFGTLTVSEPGNWVALLCFLGASALVSRLVATARAGAEAAEGRRRDVQALYDLCLGLFTAPPGPEAVGRAVELTLAALEARGGVLVLAATAEDGHGDPAFGAAPPAVDRAVVAEVRESLRMRAAGEVLYLPLEVGGHLNGVLACHDAGASAAVRESAARLLALAIERERLHAEGASLEAVRASQALLTSLLRAVSHDLRTPLTAIRLEVESLSRRLAGEAEVAESLRSLQREQERLSRRIDNLLSSARLESGLAQPHPEPVEPAELFRAGRESLAAVLADRRVIVQVEADCPPLWIDPSLALEALVNLLENAARAAPPGAPLELVAAADGGGRVHIEVRDRGPGLPPALRQLLQPGSALRPGPGSRAGDSVAGGLGLLIARGLVEASGGSLALLARAGGGTVARLQIPAAASGAAA